MQFEWDESKNQKNIIKHGIDFKAAARIFDDPHFIAREDRRKDHDEVRYQIVGAVDPHGVLLVAYTERYKNKIRIISARKADKKEQSLYQKNF